MVLDTFCRTLKYLLGLALAVPCIGYDWVKESIKQLRRGVEGRGGGKKERRGLGEKRRGEREEESWKGKEKGGGFGCCHMV